MTESLKKWCFWTVVLEKTLESPLDFKEIQPIHPKDQSWVFIGRTDAEAETPILWLPYVKSWFNWKRPWCWEGLGAGGEGDDRGWDGWMASLTRWTWVWVNSRSWWRTGRPGMLRFKGSQRVGHDWATELNWWLNCFAVHLNLTQHCKSTIYSSLKFKKKSPVSMASQVAQRVKRLLAMQETWVQSLGWEDPLEKEMAPHSRILAWRIPWTEQPGRL